MQRFAIIIIILLFPLLVLAQGTEVGVPQKSSAVADDFKGVPEVGLGVDPGILPDSPKYILERTKEWLEVNLFTLSTKKKQEKKVELASERLAELAALLEKRNGKPEYLRLVLERYENFLRQAEDMAEKIIILDGAEIGIGETLEATTRLHERFLAELLEKVNPDFSGFVYEALSEAKIENEKIFKFMVKNYQQTAEDIAKHQKILDEHLKIIKARMLLDFTWAKAVETLIEEAEKFQKAGLNSESYDFVKKAKNLIY